MRILHSLAHYLFASENWIYPQILADPTADVAVLCRTRDAAAPLLPQAHFLLDPPPWSAALGLARAFNSICFRAGHPSAVARRAVRGWRPDLIHAHFGSRGWEMLPFAREAGAPLVVSFYGTDAWALPRTSALWRNRLAELFRSDAWFVAEGPAMQARLIELGAQPEKVVVVRIGVDLGEIRFAPRRRAPGEALRVLMFGRFVEKKGFPSGLRACANAIAAGADLQITLAGDAKAGEPAEQAIKAELQSLAAEPALQGRVKFTGFVPLAERFLLFHEHDVILVPSRHAGNGDAEGGAPVTLTEAMAAGLLPVGTRHCDIPMLIEDEATGRLAPADDEEAMAAILRELATLPSDRRSVFVAQARRKVETYFSRERQMAALRDVYRMATSTRPAPTRDVLV